MQKSGIGFVGEACISHQFVPAGESADQPRFAVSYVVFDPAFLVNWLPAMLARKTIRPILREEKSLFRRLDDGSN